MGRPIAFTAACAVLLLVAGREVRTAGWPPHAERAQAAKEFARPGYALYPEVHDLVSRNPEEDCFALTVVAPPGERPERFHLALTLFHDDRVVVRRERVAPARAGRARFREEDLVPLWEVVFRARPDAVLPHIRYVGFQVAAEVRAGGPSGPLVYRLPPTAIGIGISPEALLARHRGLAWWFAACIFAVAVFLGRWRTEVANRPFVLAFTLLAGCFGAGAVIGASDYALIALPALAFVTIMLPRRTKVAMLRPFVPVALAISRRPAALLSPAWMSLFLLCWLLAWHYALLAAFGLRLRDVAASAKLTASIYLVVAVLLSSVLHARLAAHPTRRGSGTRCIVGSWLLFFVATLVRAFDWGTFYYSGAHVDPAVWRLAGETHIGAFARTPLAAAALAAATAGLTVFALLLLHARRSTRNSVWTPAPAPLQRAFSIRAWLVVNATVTLLAGFALTGLLVTSWGRPAKDVNGHVQDEFMAIPEGRVVVAAIARDNEESPPPPRIDEGFRRKLAAAGVRLGSLQDPYPLLKPSIHVDAVGATAQHPAAPRANLVVVLAESFSSWLVHPEREGVRAPNLEAFRADSISFDRLFSADFPTVKGTVATLGSFAFDEAYLESRGRHWREANVLLLSDILGQQGYEAVHAQSDYGSFEGTRHFLLSHRYSRVFGADSREVQKVARRPMLKSWGVFDDDLFSFAIDWLEHRPGAGAPPFLLTIALTDTHFPFTGFRTWPAAGENPLFASVLEVDNGLGRLWRYLRSSRFGDNTVVLITADHAMAPSAARGVRTRGERQMPYDYLVAVLHVPGGSAWRGMTVPVTCSQLDLAPTLLDILRIDTPNAFLGVPIFTDRPRHPLLVTRELPPADALTPEELRARQAVEWNADDQETLRRLLRWLVVGNRVAPRPVPPAGAERR